MPNWSYNTLTIKDSNLNLIKLKKLLSSKHTELDFEKIKSPNRYILRKKKIWRKMSQKEKERWGVGGGSKFGSWVFNNGLQDWNCRHWGTKWNSSCDYVKLENNELIYSFDTAWGPPMGIINLLFDRFKTIDIELTYSIEGGQGSGEIKTENRKTVIDDHWTPHVFECPECENYFEEREDKTGMTECPECGHAINIEEYKLAEEI